MTKYLEELPKGSKFLCPWNGQTFTLLDITPSACWVEVIEDKEFEIKVKKTGETKVIKTKVKRNEPWSRRTMVEPL